MKKKEYKIPTMKVAVMKHRTQLLAGSGTTEPGGTDGEGASSMKFFDSDYEN